MGVVTVSNLVMLKVTRKLKILPDRYGVGISAEGGSIAVFIRG
jgi:hypothetical protein